MPDQQGPVLSTCAHNRRCAVLGSPIAHSLSPALHTAAYAQLGLDWTYGRFEVSADELAAFVAGCDETWRGLSLTMPLKEAALSLGEPDWVAERLRAANTLIFDPDGIRLHNTDVGGLVAALRAAAVSQVSRVSLLGAGATARSALASVAELGAVAVTVSARRLDQARALTPLAADLGLELAVSDWAATPPPADLLISTVAAGAVDERAEALARTAPVVFDVVYDPWPTALAAAAAAVGATVVSGLDLLVHQAVLQVELMTGRTVDPAVLLPAGQAALAARSRP